MTRPPVYSLDLTTTGDPELVVDVRDAFCLYTAPDGAVAALRGLTLHVAKGERVVVQGPNGSGKTTLLRVLMGEQPLSAGRAVVAGRDVLVGPGGRDAQRLSDWRGSHVGWVDQIPARALRPELTVLRNVMLQQRLAGVRRGAAREAAFTVMERLGVDGLSERSPVTLSGGEAQRVAICAALAHKPRLVLADEPCGQLDVDTANSVYDALAEAVELAGASLVLVSHDRHASRIADRVVRIRDGRLSETWTAGHGTELLVVDDRGWVRLPEPLRHGTGGPRTFAARLGGEPADGPPRIVLTPVDGAAAGSPPKPSASASPSASPAHVPGQAEDRAGAAPGPPPGEADRPLARLAEVRISFGGRVVLDGVDLDVHAGQLLVVRGRSGSGKSTLLRLLVGLDRPDDGDVTVDGTDLGDLDREGLAGLRRRLTAVVGQDVHLAETVSARANVELARAVRGLPDGAGGVPADRLGLAGLADRPVQQLSGGERQRAAVLRALSVDARLIVLDEPSSQLDEASAEQLAAALVAAARAGAAVVVATHDPVLVAVADRVVDLEAAATA